MKLLSWTSMFSKDNVSHELVRKGNKIARVSRDDGNKLRNENCILISNRLETPGITVSDNVRWVTAINVVTLRENTRKVAIPGTKRKSNNQRSQQHHPKDYYPRRIANLIVSDKKMLARYLYQYRRKCRYLNFSLK